MTLEFANEIAKSYGYTLIEAGGGRVMLREWGAIVNDDGVPLTFSTFGQAIRWLAS